MTTDRSCVTKGRKVGARWAQGQRALFSIFDPKIWILPIFRLACAHLARRALCTPGLRGVHTKFRQCSPAPPTKSYLGALLLSTGDLKLFVDSHYRLIISFFSIIDCIIAIDLPYSLQAVLASRVCFLWRLRFLSNKSQIFSFHRLVWIASFLQPGPIHIHPLHNQEVVTEDSTLSH